MKKAFLPFILIFVLLLSGCGSKSGNTASYSSAPQEAPALAGGAEMYDTAKNEEAASPESMPDGSFTEKSNKIIKTGNMSISITDFDNTMAAIKEYVENNGGYIQNSNIYNRTSGGREYRNANFTLRIPAENYEALKEYLISMGKLNDYSDQIDDVTTEYYDIDSRLNTKRKEEERLLELLDKAEKIEDIIAIEARLSEVRSDIEVYEMRLKGMDELVSYSTLYLDMREDLSASIQPVGDNLGQRILQGLKSSVNTTIELFEGLIIGAAYISVPLISVLIIAFTGILVYKKTKKNRDK